MERSTYRQREYTIAVAASQMGMTAASRHDTIGVDL